MINVGFGFAMLTLVPWILHFHSALQVFAGFLLSLLGYAVGASLTSWATEHLWRFLVERWRSADARDWANVGRRRVISRNVMEDRWAPTLSRHSTAISAPQSYESYEMTRTSCV